MANAGAAVYSKYFYTLDSYTAKVRYVKDVQPLHHKALFWLKQNSNLA